MRCFRRVCSRVAEFGGVRPGVSSGSFLVSVFSGVRRQVGSGPVVRALWFVVFVRCRWV